MKIGLITDLHISATEDLPLGIPVKENFLKVLKACLDFHPDMIVLNGDLCHKTGERSVYEWIKSEIDKTSIAYFGIPGNHDDALLMHEVFGWPLEHGEMYYTLETDEVRLIFMDSSKGKISELQLSWLREELNKSSLTASCIFIHHPPVLCNSRHMEPAYALENMDEVQELFRQFTDRKFLIFSGHYHMDSAVSMANMTVFVTPSTFFQIDPDSVALKKLHDQIGFRIINPDPSQKCITSVHYIM
jgi:Icc protein